LKLWGEIRVSVWRHGALLAGMMVAGVRKLKLPRWRVRLKALLKMR